MHVAASTERIRAVLEPAVTAQGCSIWGIEYEALGRRSLLRVYIDREEGVSVDDCERVSRAVSDILDVEELITSAFTLEVSSPGLDRVLFTSLQYRESIGAQVDVRLRAPQEGRRRWVGRLDVVDEEGIEVAPVDREEPIRLRYEDIGKTRIVPDFDE